MSAINNSLHYVKKNFKGKRMPKVRINKLNIHYQQHGKGPDVVLIHGITGNLSIWFMKILPVLSKKYRVTVYDLRGHGYSDRPQSGYTSDDMVEDLKGVVLFLASAASDYVNGSIVVVDGGYLGR